ncbi:hypothetical protein HK102_011652 [Quaeritorhiza haematococci]|nr:hypothetical protein HK102_011652 [Quaeritorhiza haematococci]
MREGRVVSSSGGAGGKSGSSNGASNGSGSGSGSGSSSTSHTRKITYLKKHLHKISVAYQEILTNGASSKAGSGTPSAKEIEFMKLLNSEETFKLAANLSLLHSGDGRGTVYL